MALPVYGNDLITIATGDLNFDLGVWDESSDGGWDTAGGPVDDEDLWYVDTLINTGEAASSCTAAQYTKPGTGTGATGPGTMMYAHNTTFTVPTDGIVSVNKYWAAPPSLNPYAGTFLVAEAGVSVLIGSSAGDFDVHYVAGSDKYPTVDRNYATYFVDPTVTPAGTVGTVTTLSTVGIAIAAGAQARGNPLAVQSVRYGRGEVSYTLGEIANPANFEGYAVLDRAPGDKFNLLETTESGLKSRGLMTFGTAADPVYFEDADISLVIADDLKVGPNFNKGVVTNASSVLNWNNVSIKNLGLASKYTFTVNDGAETNHTGGTHEDCGPWAYGLNSTNIGVTYRRQETVTQLSSSFTNCTFDKSIGISALISNDLSKIDSCQFNKGTTGYAVDIENITTTQALSWKNFETGYVTGTTGADVGVTPTGNETILVNVSAGETLTINVGTGASTPSVANSGTGTVAVVAGQVTADWTVSPSITGYEYAIYTVTAVGSLEGASEVQHVESTISDSFSYTYTYSAGVVIAVQIIDDGLHDFEENISYYPLSENNQSFTINLAEDTNN